MSKNRYDISYINNFVRERFEGECLSDKYTKATDQYIFKCKNGHIFTCRWDTISSIYIKKIKKEPRSWCKICSKISIKTLQDEANKRGGFCLSESYSKNSDKYEWKCEAGHIWKTSWMSIKSGTWCPECPKYKYNIENLKFYAKEQGGKCLSDKYVGNKEKYLWQCERKHTWEASWDNINSGNTWCPKCKFEKCGRRLYSIKDLQDHALRKGGRLISSEYITVDTLYVWECEEKHQWKSRWSNIKYNNTWCKKCIKLTIEDAQKIAEQKGGLCLSKTYINRRTNMLWMCGNGHKWKATLGSVKYNGTWCSECISGKSENACRYILEDFFSNEIERKTFPRKRPKFFQTPNGYFEFDGYNKKLGIAFEYYGLQHYKYIPYFHKNGPEDLEKQKERDKLKREICIQNKIHLIEIPFNYTHRNKKKMADFIYSCLTDEEKVLTLFSQLPFGNS